MADKQFEPSEIGIKEAKEIVQTAGARGQEQRLYYANDHWQNGNAWIGPAPSEKSSDAAAVMALIKRQFTWRNAVREIVDRHIGSVFGAQPHWKLSTRRPLGEDEQPTAEEQALIDEGEALLTDWLDERLAPHNYEEDESDPVSEAIASSLLGGRGVLRLFVPPALLTESEGGALRLPSMTLEEAFEAIYLHEPDVEQAALYLHRRSQQHAGLYLYTEDKKELAEITYRGEGGQTVLRAMGPEGASEVTLDLGGRLLMHELRRPQLIGDSVCSQQRLLNMALTMGGRNVVLGGFLERVLLNAQLPGAYVEQSDGSRKFVPDAFKTGAGVTNSIVGVRYQDAQGNEQIAMPGMLRFDPVPMQTFEDAERIAYTAMLEETHQLHYLLSGDATASGVSRQQATAAFEQSLRLTARPTERAWRWLLETVLALAALFSGQAGRYKELRVYAEARIDPGVDDPEMMRVVREMVDAELMSQEQGMSRIGIHDVDAEMQRIEAERSARGGQAVATVDEADPAGEIEALLGGGDAAGAGLETGGQDGEG